jgi:RimJ/RimL family protein N-acetyltransferase
MDAVSRLDAFIPGEVVDLCSPSDDPEILDQWFRWFNDAAVTKYLAQGMFPNTRQEQARFLQDVVEKRDRVVLLLRTKAEQQLVGVASLSMINHVQRQCDMAIVIGKQLSTPDSMYFALETKARLTEHAFDVLGVDRINSTQVVDLIGWQRWQILFGFQIEGILRQKFRKGARAFDVMSSSCIREDYERIKAMRPNGFWPGKSEMFELLKRLPRKTLIDDVRDWLSAQQADYWNRTTFTLDGKR